MIDIIKDTSIQWKLQNQNIKNEIVEGIVDNINA